MKLVSSAFKPNQPIPATYTCKGANINPPLAISEVPAKAQSLVLVMHDPDAPKGDWLHWLVWDIPPTTVEIPPGSLPIGAVEGTTSFGKTGWGGPCPPSGTHHYIFELYALGTLIDIKPGSSLAELQTAMQDHVLEQTELVGLVSA